MRQTILFLLIVACILDSAGVLAAHNTEITYVGGTIGSPPMGCSGTIDTTTEHALVFRASGNNIEIPYRDITSVKYSRKLARRLGILPGITVSMLKKRKRNHFLTIAFSDYNDTSQVVVFQIPKNLSDVLIAVIEARTGLKVKSESESLLQ